uniref:Glycoprotein IX platelet n=1 Tax=Zosterops lateralis melanops TaxID=1220523 RepID=A0A8D2PVF8_ZOSLA
MELLAVLGCALLLPVVLGEDCPSPCSCWSLGEEWGARVDCSSRGLLSLPALPRLTRSLLLHNNSLPSIPAGALDSLGHLQELELWDNPWHCDCHILYLKLWLEDFSLPTLARLRCASPAHLRMKPLGQLTGNDLGSVSFQPITISWGPSGLDRTIPVCRTTQPSLPQVQELPATKTTEII